MKHVLIVAAVRHAFTRIFPLGSYLPEFGWQATILTPEFSPEELTALGVPSKFVDRARVISVPFRGDVFQMWRRLLTTLGFHREESLLEQLKSRTGLTGERSVIDRLNIWYQSIFAYPDSERRWRSPALKAGDTVIQQGHFDALISSSPYPTTHLVAAELKRRHGMFWLADFRDLWTKNHNYAYGGVRRWLEERLERRVLSDADVMTTVSPADAAKQQQLHGKPVVPVFIGFDPETLNTDGAPVTRQFTITYTGTIYPGKQNPEAFLRALSSLTRSGRLNATEVAVRFYGRRLIWLDHLVMELGLSDVVSQYGLISRSEAIRRQRESQVLLMFNWEDPREQGVYTLKLFEYLAARRPVLASGGTSPHGVEQILNEAGAGRYAPSPAQIERAIAEFYQEYRTYGLVPYRGRLPVVSQYDYREVARRFADLLNGYGRR